jgi:hypothetical protein
VYNVALLLALNFSSRIDGVDVSSKISYRGHSSRSGGLMQVTLTVQADALSPEVMHDLTRDLCTTLNREANVEASLAEAPAGPGARGVEILPGAIHILATYVAPAVHGIGTAVPDVLKHGGGVVLGESVLMVLRPYFDRFPFFKAKLHDKHGNELTLNSESVRPERMQQTIKDINETLTGLA